MLLEARPHRRSSTNEAPLARRIIDEIRAVIHSAAGVRRCIASMADQNDWRLTNEAKYLVGVTLSLKRWVQRRPDWARSLRLLLGGIRGLRRSGHARRRLY